MQQIFPCKKFRQTKNRRKNRFTATTKILHKKLFKRRNLCAYIVTIQYYKFIILYIDFSLSHAFTCSAVILLEICVNFSLSFFSHFFRATFFSEIYVFFCAMFALNLSICHSAQIPHVCAKQINAEWKIVEFATQQKICVQNELHNNFSIPLEPYQKESIWAHAFLSFKLNVCSNKDVFNLQFYKEKGWMRLKNYQIEKNREYTPPQILLSRRGHGLLPPSVIPAE